MMFVDKATKSVVPEMRIVNFSNGNTITKKKLFVSIDVLKAIMVFLTLFFQSSLIWLNLIKDPKNKNDFIFVSGHIYY